VTTKKSGRGSRKPKAVSSKRLAMEDEEYEDKVSLMTLQTLVDARQKI
jgi:hypothetical protein